MIPGSDKSDRYLELYDRFLDGLRDQPVRLLELGIAAGGSLRYWADYFPAGEIVGLDWSPPVIDHPRITTVAGSQADPEALDRCGDRFDIVIDDCSHMGDITRFSYDRLFPRLRSGGIYAIEDWGTGYWADWADGAAFGPNHCAGMVGFVKSLLDEVARNDIERGSFHGHSDAESSISSLTAINGLVIVVKA